MFGSVPPLRRIANSNTYVSEMEATSYNAERQGISGQGAQWIFGTDKFSDEDHARIQQALNTALSWDQINSRPGGGGKKVPYLAGHTVIENANKVFGFAGWDSSILHLSLDYLEKSEDGRFWMAGATAIVRITVANGCGHEDVGNSHMKDRDKGEVLSRVKKAAVTDAKKRALRLFGTQLGSQMMDKEGLKETEITHKQNQRELKANQQREARMRKEQMQQQQQQQQQQSHHDQTGESPRSGVYPAGRPPPQQQQQQPQQQQQQNPRQKQQQQQQQQRSHIPNGRPHTPQPGQQRCPPLAGSGGGGSGGGAPPPRANIPQHSPRGAPGNSGGDGGGGGGASSPRVVPQQIPPVPAGGGGPPTTAPGAAAAVAGRGPLRESSPNKAAAFRNSGSGSGSGSSAGHRRLVDPVVDPGGGNGGGGGAPAMPSLRGSPAFDYAVGDGDGDGGTSRPAGEPPTTTAARGGGGGGGDGGCGGEGDEYDMSQADFGSAFMEIDSLIQQHSTSSLSGGSAYETLAAGAGAAASGGGGDVGGAGGGLAMAVPMQQRQGQNNNNNNFKRLRT